MIELYVFLFIRGTDLSKGPPGRLPWATKSKGPLLSLQEKGICSLFFLRLLGPTFIFQITYIDF
jgi:hypothetical protein